MRPDGTREPRRQVMDDGQEVVEGIRKCFENVRDPRVVGRCDHLLIDILTITILAVICGADDWTDIELFGKVREAWLRQFLELPNGIPSHDTFSRVFELLGRNQFAAGLLQWTQALQEATDSKLVAIDGKTLRRSHRKRGGLAALHLVTAWSSQNGLTLGQYATEDKSNEITAIPELLKMLNLKGCTVTIDAMGCQKEIAAGIRNRGADYVLAVKENQPHLYEDLQQHFNATLEDEESLPARQRHSTEENGHGRHEQRFYYSTPVPEVLRNHEAWRDIQSVGCAIGSTMRDGRETGLVRYFISSLKPNAKRLGMAVRRHWSIENSQHWVLDIAFREDDRRQQTRNGAANLATVRRLAVSLLRQDKTITRGAKAKRMVAALEPSYMLRVLKHADFDA
jgi:predicted transposase YbfD/YdcC